jgi:hypothetical protein
MYDGYILYNEVLYSTGRRSSIEQLQAFIIITYADASRSPQLQALTHLTT